MRGKIIMNTQNSTVTKLAETALMAALCYVSFTFLQIKIPVPGGDATSIHIGNAFCVLAALLIGGVYGGLSGAIGMGIADPIVGYFYKQYILGQPQELAEALAKMSAAATLFNAVVSIILVAVIYNAVRPVLIKSHLLTVTNKKNSQAA